MHATKNSEYQIVHYCIILYFVILWSQVNKTHYILKAKKKNIELFWDCKLFGIFKLLI